MVAGDHPTVALEEGTGDNSYSSNAPLRCSNATVDILIECPFFTFLTLDTHDACSGGGGGGSW